MEKEIFNTLIKKDHKFGGNEYVKGRISGIQEMVCDGINNGCDEPGFANWHIPGVGEVLVTYCEPGKYGTFKNLVEKHYPGLCEFNYDMSKGE